MAFGCAASASAQTEKNLPTDDEIKVLLAQTEQALQEYKPLLDQYEVLDTAVAALKADPQRFNGPAGFMFVVRLEDASRGALACDAGSALQPARDIHMQDSCSKASGSINGVNRKAVSLYQKYLEAKDQLEAQVTDTLQQCAVPSEEELYPAEQAIERYSTIARAR